MILSYLYTQYLACFPLDKSPGKINIKGLGDHHDETLCFYWIYGSFCLDNDFL